jgi:hypothetical protein
MNNAWFTIFAVLIVGSILKYIIPGMVAGVVIDLVVLAACYIVLRRFPYIDMKRSMIFLVGMTIVSILTDLYIINGLVGNIVLLGLMAWLFFSPGGGRRPPKLRHQWHK